MECRPTTLVHATAWNHPYRYPAARANACVGSGRNFRIEKLSSRLGHDVAAADIDAGGRECAVRLLGGGGGRDGGAGF